MAPEISIKQYNAASLQDYKSINGFLGSTFITVKTVNRLIQKIVANLSTHQHIC